MRVIIYTTANCPGCFAAKRWLMGKGVRFEEICGSRGERVYPTIVIGNRVFEGWGRHVARELEIALREDKPDE